jgi:hypothetical protein
MLPEERARFLAAIERERAAMKRPKAISLSGWLVDLAHDRADALKVPAVSTFVEHVDPPAAEAAPMKPRKTAAKPKKR